MKKFTKLLFLVLCIVIAGYGAYASQKANPLSGLCLANVEALALDESDGGAVDPNKAYGYKLTNCYDNNASERGIRKIKVKQKVSGCFRTEKGANTFMNVYSVAETAKKNGNSKYKAILAVLEQ